MAYADYDVLMDMLENMIRSLAAVLFDDSIVPYQGRSYDLSEPFRRMTVIEAVAEHNPDLDSARLRDADYLRDVCERARNRGREEFGIGQVADRDIRENRRG